MSALKGRARPQVWTLTGPEEIVLKALQDTTEALTDEEIGEATGLGKSAANRARASLERRQLVRSHSIKKTMRTVVGKCPGCGALVEVPLGLHSGSKAWRPAGDARNTPV